MSIVFLVLSNSRKNVRHLRTQRAIDESLKEKYKNHNIVFIFSGHKGEAECMNEYAKSKLPNIISLVENQSRNTVENCMLSFEMLKDAGYNNTNVKKLILCTSSFHIKRSIVISTVLNKYLFDIGHIHTNEKITIDLDRREVIMMDNFLNSYSNKITDEGILL